MAKRRRRFLVGFRGDKNVVYGENVKEAILMTHYHWAQPMTFSQAVKQLQTLGTHPNGAAIFELVEVEG